MTTQAIIRSSSLLFLQMPLEHLVGGLFATPDWRLNSYLMTEGKIFHFFELHLVTDLSKHDLL